MQKKLPLDSKTLQSLSCLDPIVRIHSAATVWFKMLMKEFGFQRFLGEDGSNQLSMEPNRMNVATFCAIQTGNYSLRARNVSCTLY